MKKKSWIILIAVILVSICVGMILIFPNSVKTITQGSEKNIKILNFDGTYTEENFTYDVGWNGIFHEWKALKITNYDGTEKIVTIPGKKKLEEALIYQEITEICKDAFINSGIEAIIFENSNIIINEGAISKDVLIVGYEGSTAEKYAEKNGNPFAKIDGDKIVGKYWKFYPNQELLEYFDPNITPQDSAYINLSEKIKKLSIKDINLVARFAYFTNLKNIEEVEMTDSVINIENEAFENLDKLSEIKLSNKLEKIGSFAFTCTDLRNIELPDSLIELGNEAFQGCHNLESIKISGQINEMYGDTFNDCTNLKTVELPESLSKIRARDFRNCTQLTNLQFPDNLTEVSDLAFQDAVITYNVEKSDVELDVITKMLNSSSPLYANGNYECKDCSIEGGKVKLAEGKTVGEIDVKEGGLKGAKIVVKILKVKSIEVINNDEFSYKSDYFIGENFDPLGMVIKLTYENDEEKLVMGYELVDDGSENLKLKAIKDFSLSFIHTSERVEPREDYDLIYFDIENAKNLTEGENEITISFNEFEDNVSTKIKVNAVKKQIETFEVSTIPNKTTYTAGEDFDPTGMEIKFKYNIGDEIILKNIRYEESSNKEGIIADYYLNETETEPHIKYMRIEFNKNLAVDQENIKITCSEGEECTKSCEVTGIEVNSTEQVRITKVEKSSNPTKTSYIENEKFDPTGMRIKVTYSDGTIKIVSGFKYITGVEDAIVGKDEDGKEYVFVVTNGKKLEIGQMQVQLLHSTGKRINIPITVSEDLTLSDIQLKGPTKKTYIEGENLDTSGLTLEAVYSNGTTKTIDSRYYTITGGTSLAIGKIVSIYCDFEEMQKTLYLYKNTSGDIITINKNQVEDLRITLPSDYILYDGHTFDKSELTIVAIYTNGTEVTISPDDCSYNIPKLKVGDNTIKVTYGGVTEDITVKVTANEEKSIAISKIPDKEYFEGQTFNPSGIELKVTYTDGSYKIVSSEITATGGNPLIEGNNTIIINYKGMSTSIVVVAKKLELESITVEKVKKEFIEGTNVTNSDIKVIANYNNGTKKTVTAEDTCIIENGSNLPISDKYELRVIYTDVDLKQSKTGTVELKVRAKKLTEIKISDGSNPTKTIYYEEDNFDPRGIIIEISYDNGSVVEVSNLNIINSTETDDITKFEGTSSDGKIYAFTSDNAKNLPKGYDYKIRIKYEENGISKTCDYTIAEIKEITEVRLRVAKNPDRLEYTEGEDFDPYGMTLMVVYNSGKEKEIKSYEILHDKKLEYGQTSVILRYYKSKDSSIVDLELPIVVYHKEITKVEITKNPDKMQYIEEEDFNAAGMELKLTYNNNEENVIKDVKNYETGKDGSITLEGKLYKSEEDDKPETVYFKVENATFLEMTDNKTLTIKYTQYTSDTINHKGTEANVEQNCTLEGVQVVHKKLEKLGVDSESLANVKVSGYIEEQDFIPEGLILTLEYDNKTKATLSELVVDEEKSEGNTLVLKGKYTREKLNGEKEEKENIEVQVTNGKGLILGQDKINIKYKEEYEELCEICKCDPICNARELETNVDIEKVKHKKVTRIEVSEETLNKIKTTGYIEEQDFDPKGLEVKVYYNNEKDKVITDVEVLSDKKVLPKTEEDEEETAEEDLSKRTMFLKGKINDEDIYFEILNGKDLVIGQETVTLSYTENYDEKCTICECDPVCEAITVTCDIEIERVKHKKIESITMNENSECETNYIEELDFNPEGLILDFNYNNGKTYTVSNIVRNETEEIAGETLMKVIGEYSDKDGNTKNVSFEIENAKDLNLEQRIVTVKYTESYDEKCEGKCNIVLDEEGKETGEEKICDPVTVTLDIDVEIEKKQLEELIVYQEPKMEYVENDCLNPQSMILVARFTNKTLAVIYDIEVYDVFGDEVKMKGNFARFRDNEILEEYEVTNIISPDGGDLTLDQDSMIIGFTYDGITKETKINNIKVNPKILEKIELESFANKIVYIEGQDFSKAGIQVRAYYTNASSEVVTDFKILDGVSLRLPQKEVIVSYTRNGISKSTIQPINVIEPENVEEDFSKVNLTDLKITKVPHKIDYIEGENFNINGMEVTAVYSNGAEKTVMAYVVKDGIDLKVDQTTVTIAYTDKNITKEVQQNIRVEAKKIEVLEITKNPDKIEYKEGESFVKDGMTVVAHYNDGSVKELEEYEIINGDCITLDQTEVIIRYTENDITKEIPVDIKVNKPTIAEIKVTTMPEKLTYFEHENFDDTGIEVFVKYTNGSEKPITEYEIVDGKDLKADQKEVTIKYSENGVEKETKIEITVEKIVMTDIEIRVPAEKLQYKENEDFDVTGMKIIAKYNNGTEKEVTEYQIADGKGLKANQKDVTIVVTDNDVTKEIKQEITVEKEQKATITARISDNYIYCETPKTAISTFKDTITDIPCDMKFYDKNGNEISNLGNTVKTGMKVNIANQIEFEIVVVGDVNEDGKVDGLDSATIKEFRTEKISLTGSKLRAADTNEDGKVNRIDSFILLYYRVGKINVLSSNEIASVLK